MAWFKWSPKLPLWENPFFRLELRWWRECFRLRRARTSEPGVRRRGQSYRALVAGMLPIVAFPYVLAALPRCFPGIEGFRAGGVLCLPLLVRLYVILLVPGYVALMAAFTAAGCIPRRQQRRTFDALLMTRLSPGEMIEGIAGAVILTHAVLASCAFLVWLLFPPFPGDVHFVVARSSLPSRALIACLWLDTLALVVAAAFAGVAWSVGTTTPVQARLMVSLNTAWALSFAANLLAPWIGRVIARFYPAEPWTFGMGAHAAGWACCLCGALVHYVFAQVGRPFWPRPVALIPGSRCAMQASGRTAGGILVVTVALLLAPMVVLGPPTHAERLMKETDALMAKRRYREALAKLDPWLQGHRAPGDWTWELLLLDKVTCHRKLRQRREAILAAVEWRRYASTMVIRTVSVVAQGDAWHRLGSRRQARICYLDELDGLRRSIGDAGPFADLYRARAQFLFTGLGVRLADHGARGEADAAFRMALWGDDLGQLRKAREGLAALRERPASGARPRAQAPVHQAP